jgi:hypothetical protein
MVFVQIICLALAPLTASALNSDNRLRFPSGASPLLESLLSSVLVHWMLTKL